ncbi:MAG: hypothetical protein HY540_05330 [Deltaproteobacteria bacterium]|nr:hypothetical protein [Deltaproteobacteria bacterium]
MYKYYLFYVHSSNGFFSNLFSGRADKDSMITLPLNMAWVAPVAGFTFGQTVHSLSQGSLPTAVGFAFHTLYTEVPSPEAFQQQFRRFAPLESLEEITLSGPLTARTDSIPASKTDYLEAQLLEIVLKFAERYAPNSLTREEPLGACCRVVLTSDGEFEISKTGAAIATILFVVFGYEVGVQLFSQSAEINERDVHQLNAAIARLEIDPPWEGAHTESGMRVFSRKLLPGTAHVLENVREVTTPWATIFRALVP